jgi:hypothetical protein
MKILDPRSGNEVFVDYPRDFPADANSAKGFMASVRILQEGLDRPKPPSMAARASWRLFGSRTSSGARALSPLTSTPKRSVALKVALAALCISGWSAFGYEHWSFAAAERDRLAEIAATAAEREQFRGELTELRHRTGDLRAVQDKLTAAREELRLSTAARDKALAQLSGFQRELSVVSSRLDKPKETVTVTGGIRKIEAPTRAR